MRISVNLQEAALNWNFLSAGSNLWEQFKNTSITLLLSV